MLQGSAQLQKKSVKIIPHVIDTTLLASALILLYFSQWSVIEQSWLQVKIISLLVYIGLGMVALKYGQTLRIRFFAWISGLLVFLFIVSVALTKYKFGFFNGLFV